MQGSERIMPALLKELHQLEFDYADGDGIDFEPYPAFMSEDDTRQWIRAWTGNATLDGHQYLVFGQDGSGGYAAFWCVGSDVSILHQPIVFFGSEGELGVVAADFDDYLWLLAGGVGPYESVGYSGGARSVQPQFMAFAIACSAASNKEPLDVVSRARAEFPDFESDIRSLIAYK
jgi:hypothetical protein